MSNNQYICYTPISSFQWVFTRLLLKNTFAGSSTLMRWLPERGLGPNDALHQKTSNAGILPSAFLNTRAVLSHWKHPESAVVITVLTTYVNFQQRGNCSQLITQKILGTRFVRILSDDEISHFPNVTNEIVCLTEHHISLSTKKQQQMLR